MKLTDHEHLRQKPGPFQCGKVHTLKAPTRDGIDDFQLNSPRIQAMPPLISSL